MGEKETILIHTYGGSTEMGPKKWPKKWQFLYFLDKETINLPEILSFLSLQTVKQDRIWVTAYKINFVTMITVSTLKLSTTITK